MVKSKLPLGCPLGKSSTFTLWLSFVPGEDQRGVGLITRVQGLALAGNLDVAHKRHLWFMARIGRD